jgi:hypothetical protein
LAWPRIQRIDAFGLDPNRTRLPRVGEKRNRRAATAAAACRCLDAITSLAIPRRPA